MVWVGVAERGFGRVSALFSLSLATEPPARQSTYFLRVCVAGSKGSQRSYLMTEGRCLRRKAVQQATKLCARPCQCFNPVECSLLHHLKSSLLTLCMGKIPCGGAGLSIAGCLAASRPLPLGASSPLSPRLNKDVTRHCQMTPEWQRALADSPT